MPTDTLFSISFLPILHSDVLEEREIIHGRRIVSDGDEDLIVGIERFLYCRLIFGRLHGP
jgi:hypothetical protein